MWILFLCNMMVHDWVIGLLGYPVMWSYIPGGGVLSRITENLGIQIKHVLDKSCLWTFKII